MISYRAVPMVPSLPLPFQVAPLEQGRLRARRSSHPATGRALGAHLHLHPEE